MLSLRDMVLLLRGARVFPVCRGSPWRAWQQCSPARALPRWHVQPRKGQENILRCLNAAQLLSPNRATCTRVTYCRVSRVTGGAVQAPAVPWRLWGRSCRQPALPRVIGAPVHNCHCLLPWYHAIPRQGWCKFLSGTPVRESRHLRLRFQPLHSSSAVSLHFGLYTSEKFHQLG